MTLFKIGESDAIGVMVVPNRKRPALYEMVNSTTIKPLAYFRDEECAGRAEVLLEMLAKGFYAEAKP